MCKSPGSESWAKWRVQCGVTPPAKDSKLTQLEAYLLLIRSDIRQVCLELGIRPPTCKYLTKYEVAKIADLWIQRMGPDEFMRPLKDAIVLDEMTAAQLLEVAHVMMGKRRGVHPRTVNRRLRIAGMQPLDRRSAKIYASHEVARIAAALHPDWRRRPKMRPLSR
jgi:hypothetical protein